MKDDPRACRGRRTHDRSRALVPAPSAPGRSVPESRAAYRWCPRQARCASLTAVRSPGQALQHRANDSRISSPFDAQQSATRELNRDRARTGRGARWRGRGLARLRSGTSATLTCTSAVAEFDLRGCRSPLSYCRFQRNTWFAFTPLASATLATLAPGSRVSFTILSFSSTPRKIRRFRPDDTLASMRTIVSRRSPRVQMG